MGGAGAAVGGAAAVGVAGDAPVMFGVNLCGSPFSCVGAGDAVPVGCADWYC
jgi:hypothetical protein